MQLKSKRANINVLTTVAYGIVGLAIIVGIGMTILTKFGDTVVQCAQVAATWNVSNQVCSNLTASTAGSGSAYTGITYSITQLGSTGLLSWLPAIIALMVGVFFLFYFMGGKNQGP